MKLIRKLLRSHLSILQLAGFMLTNLVGVAIVLTATQIYRDVRPALSQPDSFLSNDYLIISKKVSVLSALGGGNNFSRAELDELAAKPFVTDLGEFTTARYSITGRVAAGGMDLSTFLFFESVPDRFLDVKSDVWGFSEGDRTIPIILPKNYLNLYNFGFAQSQGLPQVSPELFGLITFDLSLSGNGRTEYFKGRVAAFSNRINTILVPQSFMEWSNNAELAPDENDEPSRIIMEVRNAADTELHQYLQSMGYEIEGGNQDGGRTAHFLRLITAVVAGIGALITVLSFFILMLSIFLLLQKNTRKLENLLLLGYSAAQVSFPYQLLTLALNMIVLSAAIPLLLWVRSVYLPYMEFLAPGYTPGGIWATVAIGLGIVLFVTLVNCVAIRRKVNSLRRHG